MKGDFTRNTFRPKKQYSSVRMQQGRVQIDADWNEALDILTHRARTTRIDVIGHCGAPIHNPGYEITSEGSNLRIGAGRYYVHGILCENESRLLITEQDETLPGYLLPETPARYLAYLDVWERHITALEDPDIREVALGGPDTATRLQVTPQVKLTAVPDDATCSDFGPDWVPAEAVSSGQLAARAQPAPDSPNPCEVPPRAGYRRLENQLYRVEIHTGGGVGTATFKWSRENGSVVTRWLGQDGPDKLIVSSAGRDDNLGFATDQWIELTDDTRELQGRPGVLVRILLVDGTVITIDTANIQDPDNPGATTVDFTTFGPNAKIRRWESDGAEAVSTADWIELEDGVQIRFSPAASHNQFQTGDYWQIPARTIPGDVLWPVDETSGDPEFQPRHGIHHYYCPLALVSFTGNGWGTPTDCRPQFPPLTELPTGGEDCCTVSVGDGVLSSGDFTDIQAAVNSLEQGGKVCILPGVYQLREPVTIEGKEVIICGCGRQSHIIATANQPAIEATNGRVKICSLFVDASTAQGAIVLRQCTDSEVVDCAIRNRVTAAPPIDRPPVIGPNRPPGDSVPANQPAIGLRATAFRNARRTGAEPVSRLAAAAIDTRAGGPAITVLGGSEIRIRRNMLFGLPAIIFQADGGHIEDNRMLGGGVWIWDGSENVTVAGNDISQGDGPGILLGGVRGKDDLRNDSAGVQDIQIVDNHIQLMAHSGIASATEMDGVSGLGDIEDVVIAHNRIEACALRPQTQLDGPAYGGVVLLNAANIRLHENEISANGGEGVPACGIFAQMVEGLEVTNNRITDNGLNAVTAQRCVDFTTMAPNRGSGPLTVDDFQFTATNFDGQVAWQIQNTAAGPAFNVMVRTEIQLPEAVTQAELRYTKGNAAGGALVVNADGSQTEVAMPVASSPQTLSLSGPAITQIIIEAPQNEVLLYRVCAGEVQAADHYQAGIVGLWVFGGEVDLTGEANARFQAGGPALFVHNNVVVSPRGQALLAAGLGPMSLGDNSFTSRGEYRQPIPADENVFVQMAQTGRCVSVVNLGLAVELSNAPILSMRTAAIHPEARLVAAPTATPVLPHGFLALHGNQINQEIPQPTGRFALPSVLLISLDDISMQDNQVRATVTGAIQLSNALAWGATVRADGNRLSELFNTALASCISTGIVNNTSDNIGTHCIFVLGNVRVNRDNQVVNAALCEQLSTALGSIATRG